MKRFKSIFALRHKRIGFVSPLLALKHDEFGVQKGRIARGEEDSFLEMQQRGLNSSERAFVGVSIGNIWDLRCARDFLAVRHDDYLLKKRFQNPRGALYKRFAIKFEQRFIAAHASGQTARQNRGASNRVHAASVQKGAASIEVAPFLESIALPFRPDDAHRVLHLSRFTQVFLFGLHELRYRASHRRIARSGQFLLPVLNILRVHFNELRDERSI